MKLNARFSTLMTLAAQLVFCSESLLCTVSITDKLTLMVIEPVEKLSHNFSAN